MLLVCWVEGTLDMGGERNMWPGKIGWTTCLSGGELCLCVVWLIDWESDYCKCPGDSGFLLTIVNVGIRCWVVNGSTHFIIILLSVRGGLCVLSSRASSLRMVSTNITKSGMEWNLLVWTPFLCPCPAPRGYLPCPWLWSHGYFLAPCFPVPCVHQPLLPVHQCMLFVVPGLDLCWLPGLHVPAPQLVVQEVVAWGDE